MMANRIIEGFIDHETAKFNHLASSINQANGVEHKEDSKFFSVGFREKYKDTFTHLSSYFTVMELLIYELTAFVDAYQA